MYRLLNNLIVCLVCGRKTTWIHQLAQDFVVMSLATENNPSLLRSDIPLASKRGACSVLIPIKFWAQIIFYYFLFKDGVTSTLWPSLSHQTHSPSWSVSKLFVTAGRIILHFRSETGIYELFHRWDFPLQSKDVLLHLEVSPSPFYEWPMTFHS